MIQTKWEYSIKGNKMRIRKGIIELVSSDNRIFELNSKNHREIFEQIGWYMPSEYDKNQITIITRNKKGRLEDYTEVEINGIRRKARKIQHTCKQNTNKQSSCWQRTLGYRFGS